MRKGVIVLTEGRSGSSWLGSLARNAGLGNSGEWLDPALLGKPLKNLDFNSFVDAVLTKGSSDGNDFFVKIFPRHLFEIERNYGEDFIQECRSRTNVKIISLTRTDRLRQAISFSRGLQIGQWTSRHAPSKEPEYDYEEICRCLFLIGRSYDFWNSYVFARDIESKSFIYEDLINDPSPFINEVATSMGKNVPAELKTDLRVQRDDLTEVWVSMFKEDSKTRNFLPSATPARPARRTVSNLVRFLRGRQLKPVPYAF